MISRENLLIVMGSYKTGNNDVLKCGRTKDFDVYLGNYSTRCGVDQT
jgi:hypothetical protein